MRMSRSSKGFTIIELVIVISVLALLATIVLSRFQNISEQAKYSQIASNTVSLRSAIQRYYAQNSRYPSLAEMQALQTSTDTLLRSTDGYSNIGDYISGIPFTPAFKSNKNLVNYPKLNTINNWTVEAVDMTPAAAGSGGWLYSAEAGIISPFIPSTQFGARNWHTQNENF